MNSSFVILNEFKGLAYKQSLKSLSQIKRVQTCILDEALIK